MTIASLAALVSTNVLLAQSLRAKSILSTLTYVLTAVLAQMFALQVLLLQANNYHHSYQLNSLGCRYLCKDTAAFFVPIGGEVKA